MQALFRNYSGKERNQIEEKTLNRTEAVEEDNHDYVIKRVYRYFEF
jgi:hypothetical protein